jgi:hypothetical protein
MNLENLLLESYEELTIDELFCEAVRRTADQVNKDAEDRLKIQIDKYAQLMKTHPEKADIYKAQLDLAHAKQIVLSMKKKLEAVKK